MYVATGNSGRLNKDVAMLAMFFAIEVAHYGIIAFKGETLELPTPAVESKKKRKRLLQLAAIAVAATTEYYGYLSHNNKIIVPIATKVTIGTMMDLLTC